jgi:uncharacterized SAM-binding protein YcdF (DUF218 family)
MLFLKTIQSLILPSVFIPLVILLGLCLLFRKKKFKIGRIIIIVGLALYYLFSITPTVDLLLLPLEGGYQTVKTSEVGAADKVVLLLGGRESDVLRASEVLRIAHLTNQQTQLIISGTDPLNPRSEEALAVRGFFTARGVPAENIAIEGRSRNTWENVRNIKEIVGDQPFFLVTSAYHMKRSIKEFEKIGAQPIPAPMDFKRKGTYVLVNYIPSASNLRNADLAIHEYFGIIFYKFL